MSKGNTNTYPNDIHKALTLMNEYKPLKLDTPTIPVQGTAFVTGAKGNKKKGVVPRLLSQESTSRVLSGMRSVQRNK